MYNFLSSTNLQYPHTHTHISTIVVLLLLNYVHIRYHSVIRCKFTLIICFVQKMLDIDLFYGGIFNSLACLKQEGQLQSMASTWLQWDKECLKHIRGALNCILLWSLDRFFFSAALERWPLSWSLFNLFILGRLVSEHNYLAPAVQ